MIIYICLYIQSLNYYKGGVGGFRLSGLPGFGRGFRAGLLGLLSGVSAQAFGVCARVRGDGGADRGKIGGG